MATVLVSILGPDRVGLVAAITGRLFDLGANLGDTTFAVLGEGAEFTSVADFPDGIDIEATRDDLTRLPELADAEVTVTPFELGAVHGPQYRITHRITVSGGNRPGLVARLCEAFEQFDANVVRLNAERLRAPGTDTYAIRVAVNIPAESTAACLATVANTAGELGLSCHWETADGG